MLTGIRKKLRRSCYFAIGLGLFWGCSPGTDAQPRTNQQSGNGGSGNASTTSGQSTASGGTNQTTSTTSGGSNSIFTTTAIPEGTAGVCGHQDFQVAQRPANVLLVLDRSASMVEDSTPTKWEIVVPTLKSVIFATEISVAWGLKLFPIGTASQCTAATIPVGLAVPVAPSNAATVNAAIDAIGQPTGNGTPTAYALNEAVKDLQAVSSAESKYILLATDGEPSCSLAMSGGTDSTNARAQAITAAGAALAAGFPTFVVGITTPDKQSALDSLNSMAVAGGKPRQDANPLAAKYYIASSAAELQSAMVAITSTIATCSFDLKTPPSNLKNVNVKLGDEYVLRDESQVDGWDYSPPDSLTVKLFGSACEKVKSLGAQTVQVLFVCEGDILY